jgi:soluble lytic murein transglycosylase-like protein
VIAVASGPAQARATDIRAYRGEGGALVLTNLPTAGDEAETAARADAVLPAGLPFRDEVMLAASEIGLDPALIDAIISVESNYAPQAVSPKGAVGLMQLMPETARRFGVADPRDPGQNIRGGARYLRYLIDIFGGDLELVLAAYNAGEGSVMRHGRQVPPFAETRAYVRKVRAQYAPAQAQPSRAPLR